MPVEERESSSTQILGRSHPNPSRLLQRNTNCRYDDGIHLDKHLNQPATGELS